MSTSQNSPATPGTTHGTTPGTAPDLDGPRTPSATTARERTVLAGGLAAVVTLLLSACADLAGAGADDPAVTGATASDTASAGGDVREAAARTPRLVLTDDHGVTVLDAETLEPVGDVAVDGFVRVNPAGDGRHVAVSTEGGFRLLDVGTWSEAHGDHAHHYVSDPALTDVTYPAEKPGHVVVHGGRTAFFDDGTGEVRVVDADHVAHGPDEADLVEAEHAHHGVAVEREDGSLVLTLGTEEERTGIVLLDAEGAEVARDETCPGVHGEAVAADETVVVGCQDGMLVVSGDTIRKVASPDAYGRMGNQAGHEESPIVLGDYKSDPDAELERPERVALVDTRDATLRLVDLPASYSFRSLGRGPDGEALVLGTDGALHVIDAATGEITRSIDVVDAWTEPDDWQQPRPALHVRGELAYVTDPAGRAVHAVDLVTGDVWRTAELGSVPNEITSVDG
ncbi:hypothetical protein CLV28_2196 [Sediminihabitans luteus]|uniref:Uncharacterized protein n=1 Tax=Sediminihabitans luteus TaxID=1138585 RepID=A0A2M9CES3_9CELL|nr:zinc metallochaperone AztD [Sediminihabitans luteus]PJJ70362.1 hypothetical protein CLV28_2196 [Sediminihabitans luteus]GII97834.1 hypothetical protein Slu03_02120 [Sediminihabitans luteus]